MLQLIFDDLKQQDEKLFIFSTIMDFCVVQGNELSSADRVYGVNCKFLFTAWAAE